MRTGNFIKATGFLALILLGAGSLFAGTGPPPPPPPPLGVPVDAGALILLIAGAGFGAAKLVGKNSEGQEKH